MALPACVKESEFMPPAVKDAGLGIVLEAVKPLILRALDKPMSVAKLAKALGVRKVQMQDWVQALVTDGVLVEQLKRKVKMVSVRKPDEELKLG